MSELRKKSDKLELIWLRGNHDIGAEIVAHLIGAKIMDEYVLGDILILHGHIFDRFLTKHPVLTLVADFVYTFLQRVSMKLARFVKYQSKTFMRCSELVEHRARFYALSKGHKYVCCGHTHHAIGYSGYYNSGCWTEDVCSYLLIEGDHISLENYV